MSSQNPEHHSGTLRLRWIEGVAIVAFWGVIVALSLARMALDTRHGRAGQPFPGAGLGVSVEFVLWALLTPLIFAFSRRYRLEGSSWPAHLGIHIALAFGVAVAVDVGQHGLLEPLLGVQLPFAGRYHPLSIWRAVAGLWFLDEFIIYLVVLSAGFARDYFWRYQERLRETFKLRAQAAELEARLSEARLMALRMQLDPHFLFNTLHAVSALVERDPGGVRRMIARLSELLRYTLENQGTQEVPLRQDLRFLEGYLEIQRIRFQGKLDVSEEIEPEALEALVPNLVLQPLVENAVRHGVGHIEGRGRIEIKAFHRDGRLHLAVSDNGPGLAAGGGDGASWREGVGLRNTRERLESLYGTAQRLELVPGAGGGLSAEITLPYHTASDLRTRVAEPL